MLKIYVVLIAIGLIKVDCVYSDCLSHFKQIVNPILGHPVGKMGNWSMVYGSMGLWCTPRHGSEIKYPIRPIHLGISPRAL